VGHEAALPKKVSVIWANFAMLAEGEDLGSNILHRRPTQSSVLCRIVEGEELGSKILFFASVPV
jgi:hypothetical protein